MSIGRDCHPFLWVVSYPKSGNTWLRAMIHRYIEQVGDAPPHQMNDTNKYWYQVVSPKPMHMLEDEDSLWLRPAAMAHMRAIYSEAETEKPCSIIKSHHFSGEYRGVPLFSPLWVQRAVYITRDPRDVLPSLAHHTGQDLEETAKMMADSEAQLSDESDPSYIPQMMNSWSTNVWSWLRQGRFPTLVTSYEDLQEDTERELKRVLEHFDVDPDEDAVKEAVEFCRFEKMKARAEEGEEEFDIKTDNQDTFFRRGEAGSYKDEVPLHLQKQIIQDHQKVMRLTGYLDG